MSTDPLFVDKVQDIVGLYMVSPDCTVVLCVDEKPQISSAGQDAAGPADGAGRGRAEIPRLRPPRHDDAFRRAQRRLRRGDR